MSRNLRLTLIIMGLFVMIISLVALAYAIWPLGTLSEQVPLAATLFAPPK